MIKRTVQALMMSIALCSVAYSPVVQADASNFPSKEVNIIVPFAAGGGSDALARLVGKELSKMWDRPVIVQNKPGADGNIGAQYVASSKPDGYTLMVLDIGIITMGDLFYKDLAFDPASDFDPVTILTFSPHVLVAHPSLEAKNVKALVEYSKAHPDDMNFASHNNSAALAGYRLSADTGFTAEQIPYKGAGAATSDLISGRVNTSLVSLMLATPLIKDGSLNAIAVASPERMPTIPEVPMVIESGVEDYVMGSWQAVVAPAGVPTDIIHKINQDIRIALEQEEVQETLKATGAEILGNSPEEFQSLITEQRQLYKEVADRAGLEPQ